METMKAKAVKEATKVMQNGELKEGEATKAIEGQTAKLPSTLFLSAAVAAIGGALVFKMMKRNHAALFVGQWVAPFLLLGIYNKLVKQNGHDKEDDAR